MYYQLIKTSSLTQKLIVAFVIYFVLISTQLMGQLIDAKYNDEINQLNNLSNDSIYIETAIKISRDIHKNNHCEEDEYHFANLAINKAILSGNTIMHAKALDNLGLLYRYHQRYDQAYPLHVKAFEMVENLEVEPIQLMIYANNAGIAARYEEKFDNSISYYLKAHKIALEENDLRNIGISSNGLGNSLSNIPERKEEALHYFTIALNAERERGESLGIAMNLLSISKYYIDIKDFDEAFKHLNELIQVNRKRSDHFGIAISYEAFGDAYLAQNKIEPAKTYYLESLRLYKNYNYQLNAAQVLNRLGNIQFSFEDYKKANEYYSQSLSIAQEMNNYSLILNNYLGISKVHENLGEYKDALAFYKLSKSYEESIDLGNQKIKIAALKNQFDWEHTETKINLLQKEQDLIEKEIESHKIKLKNQKLLTGLLLMGTVLFIGFGATQYRLRKIKLKAQNQLAEKEKVLLQAEYGRNLAQAEILISRMQINPHFIFNCLNAINLLIQKQENKKAGEYLNTFSRFIRMVLEMPKNETIELKKELQVIEYYLKLEEKRFNNKFKYYFEVEPNVNITEVKIPPLLLQPFVENAIWHGLLPSNNDENILRIKVFKKNESVYIIIEDNGVGIKNKEKQEIELESNEGFPKKSLGTKITKERIKQFNRGFNDCKINLIIDKGENEIGTQVILIIENQ